jgi:6-phospho-3-hexuloisomerase
MATATLDVIASVDRSQLRELERWFADRRRRWFLVGAGRSGLVARMAAMRLMQLGLTVHYVDDVTTPAISGFDALLVVSSSGRTATSLLRAQKAKARGAKICLLTSHVESPIGQLADLTVVVPYVEGEFISDSFRDQVFLLILDGICSWLGRNDRLAREGMQALHANLE